MSLRLAEALALLLLALPSRAAVVEEFTKLYPVAVERIAAPKNVDEVRRLVRENAGPISIGGGRYSMGGQTATEGALQLDMRRMDHVLAFKPEERTVTVEAGITWRKLQEFIDPHGLSVKIMQSYANFTVGGALGVNCHGRYINQGPLIRSVRSIQVVLADGSVVEASPKNRPDVFYAAIGGYGGIGVVTAATLELEPDEPVERTAAAMPLTEYPSWFAENIKASTSAVFHNGDIYPPEYDKVMATTFSRTARPVTIPDRLQPKGGSHWYSRLIEYWLSKRDYAKRLRAEAFDPIRLKAKPVVWRNYEASYDVAELAPLAGERSSYVLQEYFVPAGRFLEFTSGMREIFQRHHANVINVSIRHALPDPGSLMAWTRGETFAFVVWYKQGTTPAARGAVAVWTRELISAAISAGGTYYLPYQIVATPEQFHAAYPRAKEFFAAKKRLDPTYKFRNKLWDAYLPPPSPPRAKADAAVAAALSERKDWKRPEIRTYTTLPEWDIVRAADELAAFERGGLPSRFPYFAAIRRFWDTRTAVKRATQGAYPDDGGTALMIEVIGVSFTVEYAVKAAYEGTFGRLFERLSLHGDPARRGPADLAAVDADREYGSFLHDQPWYQFPFRTRLSEYLRASSAAPFGGRKLERRAARGAEFLVKALYAKAIRKATQSAYEPEDFTIRVWARSPAASVKIPAGVKVLAKLGPGDVLLELPRYEKFTAAATAALEAGIRFVQIAGNDVIVVTVVSPSSWDGARLWGGALGRWPVFSGGDLVRSAVAVPVPRLHEALADFKAQGAVVEHLYDY